MIFNSDGREYYWKRDNEPLKEHHVKSTVKFGGGNIMVWDCFSSFGVCNIVRIYGRIDKELYREILNDNLLGTIRWYNISKNDIVFQQNNGPKHSAKSTYE